MYKRECTVFVGFYTSFLPFTCPSINKCYYCHYYTCTHNNIPTYKCICTYMHTSIHTHMLTCIYILHLHSYSVLHSDSRLILVNIICIMMSFYCYYFSFLFYRLFVSLLEMWPALANKLLLTYLLTYIYIHPSKHTSIRRCIGLYLKKEHLHTSFILTTDSLNSVTIFNITK